MINQPQSTSIAQTVTSLRVTYLGTQAILVVAWWMSLSYPSARASFLPGSTLEPAFAAFLVPDLVLVVAGSLVAAVLVLLRSRARLAICCCLLGAVAYATLYTVAWTVAVSAPWFGAALMVLALVGTTLVTAI